MPDYAISPLTYALLLAVLLVLSWRRLPRIARIVGVLAEVVILLAMAPVGANLLVQSVESRVPPSQSCVAPRPTTIVVLSGGIDRRPRSPQDFTALSESSLHRLLAAVALWRQTPGARLVIAGGGWHVPEADLLAGMAEQMGVPAAAIEIEGRSHSTWENARNVARLSPAVPRRIWLVSSALHLPRALGAFRAWGFAPCAWPSGSLHVPFGLNLGYFIPQSSSLAKADLAIHELVGGAVYAGLEWKRRRSLPRHSEGVPASPASATSIAGAAAASIAAETDWRAVTGGAAGPPSHD